MMTLPAAPPGGTRQSAGRLQRPLWPLSLRQWMILGWFSYSLAPGLLALLVLGIGRLVAPQASTPTISVAIALAAIYQYTTLIGGGWYFSRAILRPLAALSRAARQIARGDLDFTLPTAQVREVNEFGAAFLAMRGDLQAALARQAELEQERQFFVSAIAHDLRTPLFVLRGSLQALEQGIASSPEKVAHYVQVAQAKADEMERLVADLFTYTRVERLEQGACHEPVDLVAVIARAIASAQSLAEQRQIALALDPPAGAWTTEGDAYLLGRAMTNLLDNALHHAPEGGTISAAWQASAEVFILRIADTGPGIAPQDLPHLFAPFYRGEVSRNRATGGAGLGLTIAQRILVAHGGTIAAGNQPEGGALFTVTLVGSHPAAVASAKE